MLFKKKKSFDAYVEEGQNNPNIIFIDVREPYEYEEGHIKNSINIPLDELSHISINQNKKLYVYCLSGARSKMACLILKQKGYKNAINIGGIASSRKEY